jgi:protein subunit release factor A
MKISNIFVIKEQESKYYDLRRFESLLKKILPYLSNDVVFWVQKAIPDNASQKDSKHNIMSHFQEIMKKSSKRSKAKIWNINLKNSNLKYLAEKELNKMMKEYQNYDLELMLKYFKTYPKFALEIENLSIKFESWPKKIDNDFSDMVKSFPLD